MAGRGAAPKGRAARARDQERRYGNQTQLPAEGYRGPSPDLPGKGMGGRRWLKATRDWWELWRRAPQAATFGPTEWGFLLETAHLVDSFHRGNMNVAAELRLRQAKLGATHEDRARLRWQISTDEVEEQRQAHEEQPQGVRARLRAVEG